MNNFSEFLEHLITNLGSQTAVAAAAQIEPTKLSRFRSDQTGLTRGDIDKLLEIGSARIVTQREINQYEDTLDHLATMWKRERNNHKTEGR